MSKLQTPILVFHKFASAPSMPVFLQIDHS